MNYSPRGKIERPPLNATRVTPELSRACAYLLSDTCRLFYSITRHFLLTKNSSFQGLKYCSIKK